MEDRLDDLDNELDLTEAALRSLEAELSTFSVRPTDRPPIGVNPAAPAPRFKVDISASSIYDLKPERADGVVRKSRVGYSFGRSARGAEDRRASSAAADRTTEDTRGSTPTRAIRSSCGPTKHTRSSSGSGAFASSGPRWDAQQGGSVDRRIRVRLHLEANESSFGLLFDRRCLPDTVAVSAVRPDSSAGRWNALQENAKRDELQILPGDVVLEVGGRRVVGVGDLKRAAGGTGAKQVDLVLRRKCLPSGAGGDRPRPSMPNVSQGAKRAADASVVSAIQARGAPKTPTRPAARVASESSRARAEVDTPTAEGRRSASGVDEVTPQTVTSTGLLPGRCCRAIASQNIARALARVSASIGPPEDVAGADVRSTVGCTFGGAARFSQDEAPQDAEELGPPLACPNDRFLSTKPTPRSACIMPPWQSPSQLKKKRHEQKKLATGADGAIGYANAPGLRGVHGAWFALVRELLNAHGVFADEEASTEAGSDLGAESSFMSTWSDATFSATSQVPGPGAYSPDFKATRSNAGRGTPSFSRYSAREPARKPTVTQESVADDASSASTSVLSGASGAPSSASTAVPRAPRGGLINPLPNTQPRVPTADKAEQRAAAARPFYDPSRAAVDPKVPAPFFGDVDHIVETGRLKPLAKGQSLGPGEYEMPSMVPGGRSAYIAPEPTPVKEKPAAPGPADYDCDRATGIVHLREQAADFRSGQGHTMSFRKVPRYVLRYRSLHPRWEAVKRRSLSAIIHPVHCSERPTSPELPEPGPGEYATDDADRLTRRVREDLLVTRWVRPSHSLCEHEHALYNPRPVDSAVRGDRRALLGPEDDIAVRRRHAVAVIHPLSQSVPARVDADEGVWRFYDHSPAPPPEGLASFSRRITFEEFQRFAAMWRARADRAERRRRPSTRLSYSLPSLEVTKDRAPAHDFTRTSGRPQSDPGDAFDEPREGDVLLLDLNAERELFHPRAPSFVDMARQRGRARSSPPAFGEEEFDDSEELILDPQPIKRSPVCLVDMARSRGRAPANAGPEFSPELSAHLWADESGVLYAYQPTSGLRLRDETADELLLSPRWERLRRRSPEADFARPLGRPGVDPRASVRSDEEEEAILTNWVPRFRPPRSRSPAARRSAEQRAAGDIDSAEPDCTIETVESATPQTFDTPSGAAAGITGGEDEEG